MRPRQAFRLIGRALALLSLTIVGAVSAGAAVLVFPQPLFPYHVAEGRLALHSDRPFDLQSGRRVLADVEARISRSVLDRRDGVHRIFVANEGWRERLVFLWSYGAGGLNYYPLTRNVFLRRSDVERDLLFSPLGPPVPRPRTLAYFAAHEIGHSFTGERVGPIGYFRLPAWIREGVAEYVAYGGEVDVEAMRRSPDLSDPSVVPGLSSPYARYRLLVAYFLEREGWTIDRLLASQTPEAQALQALRRPGG